MNINHLETFLHVVQLQSIHKTAEILYLSQPTVSARIKSLERELNTELFARQGRGLLLTEDGRKFVFYAEQILKTFEEGKRIIDKKDEQEIMVIGATSITSQYFIPFALPFWRQLHPQVQIKMISVPNELLYEKLLQRKVDIAFTEDIASKSIQKYKMIDNSMRLVVYPQHPLQYENNLSIEQLAAESLVLYEDESNDWHPVFKLFELEKAEPKIEFRVNHPEVAKSIIKNRYAIGFLPYMSIKSELENGELIEIKLEDLRRTKQYIHLSYVDLDAPKLDFLETIKESVKLFSLNKHAVE